jgi:hypothetical protein
MGGCEVMVHNIRVALDVHLNWVDFILCKAIF